MQSHLGFVIKCNSFRFRFSSLMELFCPTHNSLFELFPFCEMQNMGGKLTGTNLVVRPPVSRNISRTKTITIVDKESFCLLSDGQFSDGHRIFGKMFFYLTLRASGGGLPNDDICCPQI